MFYLSALIAITGAVGYQYFVKQIPTSINPIVSVIGIYIAVLAFSIVLLPFFLSEGELMKEVKQLNWIQLAIAGSVFMMELGFLFMFRYGWNLSTGYLITGVIINIALLGISIMILGEKLNFINAIGVGISILGVALVSYRP